ncbi:YbaB/EbfC family nucleoid-associated protein [Catellatospora tritici]|uniref:YbaB/EbfC family nucleoid-associated protein n=1 Tax=Catellatospora tritici TaxID=2851566 RepID=UPI001C2CD590|nr:YbaB/EbfC family nucleoid-associated protein [Catellatospora tritici]MBV1851914.1 YbaB/EbfC family nucleoid-associated protein [Catellatospora tritici]
MPREIDDAWIEEAIASYRRIEERQEALTRALAGIEVAVRSPDDLVEVVADADGAVRRVVVTGSIEGRTAVELTRAIQQAITAATDAAGWARRKVYEETFGGYADLGGAR